MERVKQFEEAFKKRYNRDVEVTIEQEVKNNKLSKVTAKIKYKDKEYTLEEHLNDDQRTDYVLVEVDSKTHKYKSYLAAEVFVADLIGG